MPNQNNNVLREHALEILKYFFLGWLRAAIKKMSVAQAIMYINLRDKQDIDFALATILDGANEEELQAFREGENAINLHK